MEKIYVEHMLIFKYIHSIPGINKDDHRDYLRRFTISVQEALIQQIETGVNKVASSKGDKVIAEVNLRTTILLQYSQVLTSFP